MSAEFARLEAPAAAATPIEAVASAEAAKPLFERITDTLRGHRIATLGVTVAGAIGAYTALAPTAAEAQCVTTHTAESTTTVCGPDAGDTPPEQHPSSGTGTGSGSGSDKPPSHHQPGQHQPAAPATTRLEKTYSYDMCGGWGSRICTTGCGDVVSADFASDLTGRRITPLDVLPILSPRYYIPGSGTLAEGFNVVAKHYGLHEKPIKTFADAGKAISELGGVAIAEFNNGVAISRSGNASSVAVNDHYVVLDKFRNGRFAMADPHQGYGRHTERTRNGKTRFWTDRQMMQEGLTHLWRVTP